MKNLIFAIVLMLFAFAQSCNNASTDSVSVADSANDESDTTGMFNNNDSTAAMGMGVNNNVADFAVKAANGGMMEVQLGEYASKNATDKSVKDFGSMLAKDHAKANEELKSLASSKNIALPASIGDDKTDKMNDLMKKQGKDFDKAYMNMMVDDHKNDIDMYQKVADDSDDAAMKDFAAKTLPTLKKHLNEAEAIVKSHDY